MIPQISGQVMPYQPKTFEELLEKSKLAEKALMRTCRTWRTCSLYGGIGNDIKGRKDT
jgi:hypothetical protein